MTTSINRRAALGAAIAAAGATLAAPAALAECPGDLAALIAAHRETRAALERAFDDLAAAENAKPDVFIGFWGHEYPTSAGRDEIVKLMRSHVSLCIQLLAVATHAAPDAAKAVIASMESNLADALRRLDEEKQREAVYADDDALQAIAAYRCATPSEIVRKFRHLRRYREDLVEDHYDAIFAALLPEGEALGGPDDGT